DAGHSRIAIGREDGLLHDSLTRREHQVPVGRELPDRNEGRDSIAGRYIQQIDDRFSATGPSALRNLVHLEPVTSALASEEHHVVVSTRQEEVFHPILLLGPHAADPASST